MAPTEIFRVLWPRHSIFDDGAVDIDLHTLVHLKSIRLLRQVQHFARVILNAALAGIQLPFALLFPSGLSMTRSPMRPRCGSEQWPNVLWLWEQNQELPGLITSFRAGLHMATTGGRIRPARS
jgi:hypothetical protein